MVFCEQGCTMWRLWKVQSQGLLFFFSSKTQISDPKVLDEIWLPCNLGSPKSWQSCIGIESAGEEGGQILWKGWMWGNWDQHDDIVLVCIDKLLVLIQTKVISSDNPENRSIVCEKSYPSLSTFSHLLTKKNHQNRGLLAFFQGHDPEDRAVGSPNGETFCEILLGSQCSIATGSVSFNRTSRIIWRVATEQPPYLSVFCFGV